MKHLLIELVSNLNDIVNQPLQITRRIKVKFVIIFSI